SFSDTAEESVLWSHYADKHCGVAFETSHVVDPEHLFKMEYTDKRPVIDANRIQDPTIVEDYLRPLILRLMKQKSSGWSYEREWRLFINLAECDIAGGNYFARIPDNFLTRVILGYRCPLEIQYVIRTLAAHGLSTIPVARAKMCLESY